MWSGEFKVLMCTKGRLLPGGISGFQKVLGKCCSRWYEWILVIYKFHCEVEDYAGKLVISRPFESRNLKKKKIWKIATCFKLIE